MSELKRIAIFKVGKHTATSGEVLNATPDYLRQVVAGYDPSVSESPAVIGHPKSNHPAYGWVQSLSFDEGDGFLYADFKNVESNFAQMLKDKRFKKRSSSFYPPHHPSNPTQGKPYLRHVGFLGAQPPAVKGLPDFSDGDGDCPVYEFSEFESPSNQIPNQPKHEETPMSDVTKAKAQSTPQSTPQSNPSPAGQITNDFAEQQAKLDAERQAIANEKAELEKQKAEFAKREADAKTAEFSDFADGLIKTGQLTPADKDSVISVMMDLDGSDKTFDFAEDGGVKKKSSVEVMQGLLSRLNTTVDFSERSAIDPNGADKPRHGFDTDVEEDELHQMYLDYAENNNVTYAEAVDHFD